MILVWLQTFIGNSSRWKTDSSKKALKNFRSRLRGVQEWSNVYSEIATSQPCKTFSMLLGRKWKATCVWVYAECKSRLSPVWYVIR